jgi:hypothetical protein
MVVAASHAATARTTTAGTAVVTTLPVRSPLTSSGSVSGTSSAAREMRSSKYTAWATIEWMCPSGGLECLLPAAYFGIAVAITAGWPLLLLARVRPAWPVALLGAFLSVVLVTIMLSSLPARFFPYPVFAACAVSYAVAAYVVAKLKERRQMASPES